MHPTSPTLITFASPKGGVGKSTSCLALAGALAHRGETVRVLDLDHTNTLLRWYKQHRPAIPNLTVSTVGEGQLFEHLTQLIRTEPGYILLDLAGHLSLTMLQAAAIAHLTITPAKLSEPDIMEATKLHYQLADIAIRQERPVTHRILINEAPALLATYQKHTLDQLRSSPLQPFQTMLHTRAPYAEAFLTGQPVHFANDLRIPVSKARDELNALMVEIDGVLNIEQKAAA